LTRIIHPQELHNALCAELLFGKLMEAKTTECGNNILFARQKISAQKEFGNITVAFQTVDTQILLHW
jgi:hypothetical protein